MFYCINDNLETDAICPGKDYVEIIPIEKAMHSEPIKKYMSEIPVLFMDMHFSKIDIFPGFTYGFIHIPEILVKGDARLTFICTSGSIVFIDRNDFALQCFQKILELHRDNIHSLPAVLCYMLDYIISEDLEKMNAIQQNLADLEKDILNDNVRNPLTKITNYRSSTMNLHHYYIQLSGICTALKDNSNIFIRQETRALLNPLSDKINLLSREAQQIWEYTSQIRDVYQQQLDVHQNGIMKFLTIVTTIFMPLTLIAGWYGMNFSYMPELGWRYGYLLIFILSIILVIILCLIFKKKKWW